MSSTNSRARSQIQAAGGPRGSSKRGVSGGTRGRQTGRRKEGAVSAPDVGGQSGVCPTCNQLVKYYSMWECNHKACSFCVLRSRALYKRRDCSFCRAPQPSVIFTVSRDVLFSSIVLDFLQKDARLSIYFETQEIMEETLLLLRFNCPDSDCNYIGNGWADLRLHTRVTHGKLMCDLCIRMKKVFTHEHALYAPNILPVHLPSLVPVGWPISKDKVEGGVHPLCKFCRECFPGDDEYNAHMRGRHEECFICKRNGVKDMHFENYKRLESHFNIAHHPCTNISCVRQKSAVFNTLLDLRAHIVEEHGSDKSSHDNIKVRPLQSTGVDKRDEGAGREREPSLSVVPVWPPAPDPGQSNMPWYSDHSDFRPSSIEYNATQTPHSRRRTAPGRIRSKGDSSSAYIPLGTPGYPGIQPNSPLSSSGFGTAGINYSTTHGYPYPFMQSPALGHASGSGPDQYGRPAYMPLGAPVYPGLQPTTPWALSSGPAGVDYGSGPGPQFLFTPPTPPAAPEPISGDEYNQNSWPVDIPLGESGYSRKQVYHDAHDLSFPESSIYKINQKIEDLVEVLEKIFLDRKKYRRLLSCDDSSAQRLLDAFQQLLDFFVSGSQTKFRNDLIVAAQRLASKSGLYPMCFELQDVMPVGEFSVSSGAFADIFKGTLRGCAVCLKTIRLDQQTKMQHYLKVCSKEAILWAQLSHPNVLPFYGVYRFRNRLSFVSPWMELGDITNYLQNYPSANRVLLASDVAQGLCFLHLNGIIHGDLKGPNILINELERACLADFGLSSISDPQILAWTSQSVVGSKGGSVRWQAPELFDPEPEEDIHNTVSSDIYAWACVAYEIFAGQIPFSHILRDTAVWNRVRSGERPSPPEKSSSSWTDWGLTEDIWSLMEESWGTDPATRPTVESIIERLDSELQNTLINEDPKPNNNALSPARFREMARVELDIDELSVETLEMILN